jgi:Cys-rich protein (TIGR01571 family)|eukprot:COSAG01_NODE_6942_length_3429_cov_7.702703_5_plen_165_part_00
MAGTTSPAWDEGPSAEKEGEASPLDAGLFRCAENREVCLLGAFCPCVLVSRTAAFVGEDGCICAGAWCCLEVTATQRLSTSVILMAPPLLTRAYSRAQMPCCIGAILRRKLAVALGLPVPSFFRACLWNHGLCCFCTLCQEARLVEKAKYSQIKRRGAVLVLER